MSTWWAVAATLGSTLAVMFLSAAVRLTKLNRELEDENERLTRELEEWEPYIVEYAAQLEARNRAAISN